MKKTDRQNRKEASLSDKSPILPPGFLQVAGWLHALVLFWCFYPLAALVFQLDHDQTKRFLLTGLLLLFPVILSWYAVTKLKYLILYLLVGTVVSFGFGELNVFLCQDFAVDNRLPMSFSVLMSLLIFLVRGYGRIKKGQVQNMLKELPSADLARVDYSELDVPIFLDRPSPVHWIYLAVHYVLGAFLKATPYWRMIFFLFLADVFLCFVYRFTDSFYDFLKEHSHSANLPVQTMKKVVRIIFTIASLFLLAFTLPSLLYGKEPLSELTFKEREITEEWQPEAPADIPAQGNMGDLAELLAGDEEIKEPPKWLVFLSQVVIYLTFAGIVLALLVVIYRACRRAGKFFASETEDEISFLEKGFTDQDVSLKKRRLPWQRETSANIRIRKYYKKLLRRELKTQPQGSETPCELENMAGFSENDDRKFLHSCYERARYSTESCTQEDAARLKKLSPR